MTTSDQASDSLVAALTKARIPVENHAFIRQFTTAVGIDGYRVMEDSSKSHVVARRRDGLPDLHIASGYTTGFVSEEEIVRVAGEGVQRAPGSRKPTWYVAHPTNKVRPGGERSVSVRREAKGCSCGMTLSLTGECASCD